MLVLGHAHEHLDAQLLRVQPVVRLERQRVGQVVEQVAHQEQLDVVLVDFIEECLRGEETKE